MKRIRAGWALTKKSWAVLRENRQLIRFPVYGAAAMIPLAICALLARSDARRGTHLLLRRSLTVAAGLTLGMLTLILMAVFMLTETFLLTREGASNRA